jgi:tRNA 2-thiouridine synthesizing protein A
MARPARSGTALKRIAHGRARSEKGQRDNPRQTVRISSSNHGDDSVNFDKELDARGLSCPLPILKTKKALNELASGQVLKIVATDQGSIKDMQAFSSQTGHALLSSTEESNTFVFFMKKK